MNKISFGIIFTSFITVGLIVSCQTGPTHRKTTKVTRLEMNLSAFGVESDDFPSVSAIIDFKTKFSLCKKTYFTPALEPSTYTLTEEEIDTIASLLESTDLRELSNRYKMSATDMPTSTTTIFLGDAKFEIEDYGLMAPEPIQKIYKIIYKLQY